MRRASGDGSIWFDDQRNRWRAQLDIGRGPDGRRRFRRASGRSKSEVAAKLREMRAEFDRSGVVARADLTFGDLLDSWVESLPGKVADTTIRNRRGIIELHLRPGLGSTPAGKITPSDLETVFETMNRHGYARATITKVRAIAGQSFKWGLRRRLISWNPASVAEIPKGKTARPGRALTIDETRSLSDASADDRLNALWIFLLTSGARPGEATALSWTDLDLDAGHVRIWRSWRGTGDSRHIGDTKTSGSRRSIALTDIAIDALRRHRRAQVEERLALDWPTEWSDLVFVSTAGTPIDASNLRSALDRVAEAARIGGRFTPYDLRHTAASLLSDSGVSNEVLADLLGHTTTAMVQLHYRHRVRDVVDVAGPMDRLLAAGD